MNSVHFAQGARAAVTRGWLLHARHPTALASPSAPASPCYVQNARHVRLSDTISQKIVSGIKLRAHLRYRHLAMTWR